MIYSLSFVFLMSLARSEPVSSVSPQDVNLLENGSFEQYTDAAGLPNRWTRFTASPGGSVERDSSFVTCGDYSLRLIDGSTSKAEGLISASVPITPGVSYMAGAYVFRTSSTSGGNIYIKYYNAEMTEISSGSGTTPDALNQWVHTSVINRAPANAVYARVVCYSSSDRIGTCCFDGVYLRRSRTQSLIDNPDMTLDSIGSGYPVNWQVWGAASQPVSVAADPAGGGRGNVMKLADGSASQSASAMTRIPVIPNMTYTASADIYFQSGTAPNLYLKYYDTNGNQCVSAFTENYTVGRWENISVTLKAPDNAVEAQVLAYISSGGTGISYFDNFEFKESLIQKYVSPNGTGDGSSSSSPARFNDAYGFWYGVDAVLATQSVKVIFLEGDYVINSQDDDLYLRDIGELSNVLVMEGENPYASTFTRTGGGDDSSLAQVTFNPSQNLVIRNLHWENDSALLTGSGLQIKTTDPAKMTKNVLIEGCSFVGLTNHYFGAMAASYATTYRVTVRKCEFINVGINSHAHMTYNIDCQDFSMYDCYSQDCSGNHIRFRGLCNTGIVSGCTFVSTERKYNYYFIENCVFNSRWWDGTGNGWEGNEILGSGFSYTDNTFHYFENDGWNVAVAIRAIGHNPTNYLINPPQELHYLLTAADSNVLVGASTPAKHDLVLNHYGYDFGSNMIIQNNTRYGNHRYNIRLENDRYEEYYQLGLPDPGGEGRYDISVLGGDP